MKLTKALIAALAALVLAGCHAGSGDSAKHLLDNASGDDWPGYGRTYGQQHYSPLHDVSDGNVSKLGLAWSMDLPPGQRLEMVRQELYRLCQTISNRVRVG